MSESSQPAEISTEIEVDRRTSKEFVRHYRRTMRAVRRAGGVGGGHLRSRVATLADPETGVEVRVKREDKSLRLGRTALRLAIGKSAPFRHLDLELLRPGDDDPISLELSGHNFMGFKGKVSHPGEAIAFQDAMDLFHSVDPARADARVEKIEDVLPWNALTGKDAEQMQTTLRTLFSGEDALKPRTAYSNAPQRALTDEAQPLVTIRHNPFDEGRKTNGAQGHIIIHDQVSGLPAREIQYTLSSKHGNILSIKDGSNSYHDATPAERHQITAILTETLKKENLAPDMSETIGLMPPEDAVIATTELAQRNKSSCIDSEDGTHYGYHEEVDDHEQPQHVYTWRDNEEARRQQIRFLLPDDNFITILANINEGAGTICFPLDAKAAQDPSYFYFWPVELPSDSRWATENFSAVVYERIRRIARAISEE